MTSYRGERYRIGLGGPLTSMIKYLIIANVGIFILQVLVNRQTGGSFDQLFALHPRFLHNLALWQIVSYMFLHGSLFHLFFNMLILWIFGNEVEATWGSKTFLKYYFICGIGAGLIHVLMDTLFFHSGASVVGASGAIYGVLLAFALIDPEREITFLLFFVLPVNIKAKYLVMGLAGLALFGGILAEGSVAHFAHLGGMLVGFLYLKIDWRASALAGWMRRQRASREVMREFKQRQQKMRLRESVDHILDKINEVGYENLTPEEKELLRRASEQLSKEEEL